MGPGGVVWDASVFLVLLTHLGGAEKAARGVQLKPRLPNVVARCGDKGWVDQGLFYSWLKDHFLSNSASHRPLLLLFDGHSSHFEPKSIEFARENNIILPPHTTHECQPLDIGLFGPLKKYWREECHKFYQGNSSLLITKLNFNRVYLIAWMKAVSPSNVSGGFRKSGVSTETLYQ